LLYSPFPLHVQIACGSVSSRNCWPKHRIIVLSISPHGMSSRLIWPSGTPSPSCGQGLLSSKSLLVNWYYCNIKQNNLTYCVSWLNFLFMWYLFDDMKRKFYFSCFEQTCKNAVLEICTLLNQN
jgi:hypothetical protein